MTALCQQELEQNILFNKIQDYESIVADIGACCSLSMDV